MKNYSLKETFFIAQDATGEPLELPSSDVAMACLAFDIESRQLVELHVLTHSDAWSTEEAQTLFDRLDLLAGVNGGSVPRVLRRGRLDGLIFFTLALEEGEPLTDYTSRTGSIAESTTLMLVNGLIEKLYRLQQFPRLFRACSLRGAKLIYSPQGPRHQRVIQIQQLGLHTLEGRGDEPSAEGRLAAEVGQILYQMLTGHPSPMRGGPLVESVRLFDRCVPLRQFVINSFTKSNPPQTLADATAALKSAEQFATESGTASLGMAPFAVPWLFQVFGSDQLDFLYPVQFELSNKSAAFVDEISCRPARDSKVRQPVFLLPLPGKHVLPRAHFSSAPDGLAQIEPTRVENLLLPQSTWNSDHFCFHVESIANSFTLRDLIKTRGALQPSEIVAILSQIESAHQQATQSGFVIPSLKTSAVRCVFRDDCDDVILSERCRMTVSHWPSHLFKLRVHASLNSVTNPWPVGINPNRPSTTLFHDAFVLLAVELAGGMTALSQPSDLREGLVQFLRQQATLVGTMEPVLDPAAFLRAFSDHLGISSSPKSLEQESPKPSIFQSETEAESSSRSVPPMEPALFADLAGSAGLATLPDDTLESAEEEPAPASTKDQGIDAEVAAQILPVSEIVTLTVSEEAVSEQPTYSDVDTTDAAPVLSPEANLSEQLPPPNPEEMTAAEAISTEEPAISELVETGAVADAESPLEEDQPLAPLTSPKAIAAHFSNLIKVQASAAVKDAEDSEDAPEPYQPPSPILPTFQPFQERELPATPNPPTSATIEPDKAIAPFPIEELETHMEAEALPVPSPPPVATIQPKSFPPSTTGLVTWRFESTPRAEAPPNVIPPPKVMEVIETKQAVSPPPPASSNSISEGCEEPVAEQEVAEPTQVESAPSMEELLEDLPQEDFSAPTLNIDLSRLTTSDSLFSRRPRTITIRNR